MFNKHNYQYVACALSLRYKILYKIDYITIQEAIG